LGEARATHSQSVMDAHARQSAGALDTPTPQLTGAQDTPKQHFAAAKDGPTVDYARTTDTPTGQDEADIILEVLENMHIDGGSGKYPSKVGAAVVTF
jgi:hypothetical protein